MTKYDNLSDLVEDVRKGKVDSKKLGVVFTDCGISVYLQGKSENDFTEMGVFEIDEISRFMFPGCTFNYN